MTVVLAASPGCTSFVIGSNGAKTCGGAAGGAGGPSFTDGRLNNNDPWETSAIYCLGDGSVRVYVPAQPGRPSANWVIAFDASVLEIAQVPTQPDTNTPIKAGHGAVLSRLTNGGLEVTTPGLNPIDGNYRFHFHDCAIPVLKLVPDHQLCWETPPQACQKPTVDVPPYATTFVVNLKACTKARSVMADGSVAVYKTKPKDFVSIALIVLPKHFLVCTPGIGSWILILVDNQRWYFASQSYIKFGP
jgi:hypothetical protein